MFDGNMPSGCIGRRRVHERGRGGASALFNAVILTTTTAFASCADDSWVRTVVRHHDGTTPPPVAWDQARSISVGGSMMAAV